MTVGSYEAKTHLASLLDRVEKGEEIVITRHGVPVARLVPADGVRRVDRTSAVESLREFRQGKRLGGLTIRQLIDEGRRF